jgi:hypothetical protein
MKLNIEDVEDYLKVFEDDNGGSLLSFGKRPTGKFFNTHFCSDRIDAIVNLQNMKKTPWYHEIHIKAPCEYEAIPLENARAQEDDCVSEEADKLVEQAVQTVMRLLKRNRRVFIHGSEVNRFACVVAMIVWNHVRNDREFDPVRQLQLDHFRGEKDLEEDFPADSDFLEQIQRHIKKYKHSIVACFKRRKQ